jgi:cysteine desulfurase/selenocysteine lyase
MTMRDFFPFFKRNPDITYLDTAATSQTLYTVAEDLQSFMIDHKSNAHRSGHSMGTWVDQKYYEAKNLIGQWLGIDNPEYKIVFNSGATQGLHDAVQMIKGQITGTIYIGVDFHHSLYLPFKQLADQNSFYEIKFIPVLNNGLLDLEWLKEQFIADTGNKVLAFTGISNVLGVEQDLESIANLADEHHCVTVLDASQLIGKRRTNLSRFDFVAWSWHKIYGPMGLGCLIVNKGWDLSEPVHPGGGSVTSVRIGSVSWQQNAGRFESGTQNLAAISTLPRLVKWLIEYEPTIIEHDKMLANYANSQVSHKQFTQLAESQSGLLSLAPTIGAVEDYSMLLDAKKIMVRSGKLCAQPLLEYFVRPSLIRLSWGCYTTTLELEKAFDRMGEIYEKFSRTSR